MKTDLILIVGDLVYYNGPPLLSPRDWSRIVIYDNGLVNLDDLAVVLETDNFLKIANLYFQESDIEIQRISYNFLIKID